MVHGMAKKVVCSNQQMEEQHGERSPKVYQQPNKVWEELVFVLLHLIQEECMQQLMQEGKAVFSEVTMQVKAGIAFKLIIAIGDEQVILPK